MTDAGELKNLPKGRRLVLLFASLLGLTAALCTVFALVVTAAEAWQDHVHAQWPEASAQVQQCGLDIYTQKRRRSVSIAPSRTPPAASRLCLTFFRAARPHRVASSGNTHHINTTACSSGSMRILKGRQSPCTTIPQTPSRQFWLSPTCLSPDRLRRAT